MMIIYLNSTHGVKSADLYGHIGYLYRINAKLLTSFVLLSWCDSLSFYILIAKFLVWSDSHLFAHSIEEISYFWILLND